MSFWIKTGNGNTIHIHGDPHMPEEELALILAEADTHIDNERRQRRAFNQLWGEASSIPPEMKPPGMQELCQYWFKIGHSLGMEQRP